MNDNTVDHPDYYGGEDNPYEAIKVIEAWGLGFSLGNAVKYIIRAGKKDPTKEIEDLKKARWYLDHEIERLERATTPMYTTIIEGSPSYKLNEEVKEKIAKETGRAYL